MRLSLPVVLVHDAWADLLMDEMLGAFDYLVIATPHIGSLFHIGQHRSHPFPMFQLLGHWLWERTLEA